MKPQSKPIRKTVILYASIAGMLTAAANATDITWQTPTTISGPTDVNTSGTCVGSWAPYNFDAFSGIPVNGVTFYAFSDVPGLNAGSDGFYDGGAYYNMNTSDANYNLLLRSGGYGGGSAGTFSWSGMALGDTYLVQLWVNDGRNIGQTRWETFTAGVNTSANVYYGSDGSGLGQYLIGTFAADSSGTQTITMTPYAVGGSSVQLNAFQLRDITLVPEPSSLALLAAGAGAMLCGLRRKCRAA
jgi:hypothetical protein